MTSDGPWLAVSPDGDKMVNRDYVYFGIDFSLPGRCLLRDVGNSPILWKIFWYAWMSVCEQTGAIRSHFSSVDGCRHADEPGATCAVFQVGFAILFRPKTRRCSPLPTRPGGWPFALHPLRISPPGLSSPSFSSMYETSSIPLATRSRYAALVSIDICRFSLIPGFFLRLEDFCTSSSPNS